MSYPSWFTKHQLIARKGVGYSWGSEDLSDVKIALKWPYFTIPPGPNELKDFKNIHMSALLF